MHSNKHIPDYESRSVGQENGQVFGNISIGLLAFIPVCMIFFIYLPPLLCAIFTTGVIAIVKSNRRSAKGWIGASISAILLTIYICVLNQLL
jgi:hypothetical protein